MVSKLLSELGIPSSNLFMEPGAVILELDNSFGSNRVYKYSNLNGFPKSFINRLPVDIHAALSLLRDNEHLMCHLPPKSIPSEWLGRLKVIAVFRSPRKCLESEFLTEVRLYNEQPPYNYDPELDYVLGSGLALSEAFLAWLKRYLPERRCLYEDMLSWSLRSDALCISYENLISSAGEKLVRRIAEYLDIPLEKLGVNLMERMVNSETPTRSKGDSMIRNSLFSEEALAVYYSYGLEDIEKRIAQICQFETEYEL